MKLILIIGLLLVDGLGNHDMALAFFKIYDMYDSIGMTATFDKEDLVAELKVSFEEVDHSLLQSYLDENTSFLINNSAVAFTINKIQSDELFIKVHGTFDRTEMNLRQMIIYNTCLSNRPDQSNIMQLELKDQFKDFRMHKDRTRIKVEY